MKDKKVYIILIAILAISAIVILAIVGIDKKDNRELNIIVGESSVWTFSNNKWYSNQNIEDYNWKKFSIFLDSKYMGEYSVWHDDQWYIFEGREAKDYTGNILGFSANYDVLVKEFTTEAIDDYKYVNKELKNIGIKSYDKNKITVATKTNVDIDSDGNDESFYVVSNAFYTPIDPVNDSMPDKVFAIVFMVKDDIIYSIYSDVTIENNINSGTKPYFTSFIDTNEDGIYEVLLTKGMYSVEGTEVDLYAFKDGKFELLISD